MTSRPAVNSWNDYIVRGTNSASDNAEFAKAVATMNARGKGNIVIDGPVKLTALHNITASVGLVGLPGSLLIMSGSQAAIVYGSLTNPWQLSSQVCDAVPAMSASGYGTSYVTSPNLALSPDDYVLVYGHNVLTDVSPHNPDTKYLPMELHRVSRQTLGVSGQYLLGDYFDDPISSVTWTVGQTTKTLFSPRIAKINPIRGVQVRNLNVTHELGTVVGGTNLLFRYCVDLVVENCNFLYPNGGSMSFHCCHGVRIMGCRIEDAENTNISLVGDANNNVVYGVVTAVVNEFQMLSCVTNAVRHGFTTGGFDYTIPWAANQDVVAGEYRKNGSVGYEAMTTGTTGTTPPTHVSGTVTIDGIGWKYVGTNGVYRFGTVKNALIANCEFRSNGYQDLVPVNGVYTWHGNAQGDTHTEGRRITFDGNTFSVPGESNNYAMVIRNRGAIVRNNTFNCNKFAIPIYVAGPDATIENNTFNGGYSSFVSTALVYGGTADRAKFLRNTFVDHWGPAIQVEAGTGHQIRDNSFTNCSWGYTSALPTQSAIHIQSLNDASSKVTITGNSIPKPVGLATYPADYSLTWGSTVSDANIEFFDNRCEGYGDENLGLRTPMWTSGEVVYYGYSRRSAGREYRRILSPAHTSDTAPTHASGDVNGWRFVRNYSGAQIASIESRQGLSNGRHRVVVVHVPSHGMSISQSRGMPLTVNMTDVYDDTTAATNTDCRVLLDVISEDYLVVADPGDTVELASSLIQTPYSIASNGRTLYWDDSLAKYVATKPGDSHATAPAVLKVNLYGNSVFQARILTNAGF